MSYLNEEDVRAQLASIGLVIDGELRIAAGKKSVRCRVEGEDKEKRGWYRLYEWVTGSGEIFLTGSYGVYHGDDPGTRKVELSKRCESCGCEMPLKAKECPRCKSKMFKKRELSREELDAIKARQAEDRKREQAQRNAEIQTAANWAREVWRVSAPATLDAHDYFGRKGLKGTGETRVFPGVDGVQLEGAEREDYEYLARFAGALVVPMCDLAGRVFGLQFILSRERHADMIRRTERDKEYWPAGLSKDAHYWMIGVPERLVMTAEGFATAQSIHDATGMAVAVTFDAGNQPKVAQALKKHYKRVRILACGDDDWLQKCAECKQPTPVGQELCSHCGKPHRKQNAGLVRAQEAALIADGAWILPTFSAPRPSDRKGPTDFNDLAAAEGLQAVRGQIEAKLAEMGVQPAQPPASGSALPSAGGAGMAERPAAMSVMDLDSAVDRFIPLDDGTGEFLFDKWTRSICRTKQMIAVLPAKMRWDEVKQHPIWKSRGSFYLSEVGFDPAGTDRSVKLNLWNGWPMKPRGDESGCERMLELLRYLCSGEKNSAELYGWLLKWLAYPLQHAGAKMQSAIVVHGPQGTGKSRFFEAYAKIFGDYSVILNQGALEDKFNSDWGAQKLFVIADEVAANSDKYHLKNILKAYITGEWIRVNPKNVAAHRERNHMNLVFLSNDDNPVVLENDDRRHCVIYTPKKWEADQFARLDAEIDNGGIEALYSYLLGLDLGDFKPWTKPPMTAAKSRLIRINASSEEAFVQDWLDGNTDLPVGPIGRAVFFAEYNAWCRRENETRPRRSAVFFAYIHRLGWRDGIADRTTNFKTREKQSWRLVCPPEDVIAASNGEAILPNEGESRADWFGRAFYAVEQVLERRKSDSW